MFYTIIKALAWVFIHIRCRITVTGADNIPKNGGVIICANHISFFDPVVVAVTTKRPVHFMAKKELFENRFLRFFFTRINAFPVDRKASDLQSYKKALSVLKDGRVLGIFAQGTRIADADMKAAKSGAAMFALKSGAAVIPAGITGSYKWFGKVNITFGRPLTFDEYASKKAKRETIDEVTDIIINNVNEILNNT